MDYKKDFLEAKAANDWTRLEVLWQQLCQVCEIEEISNGSAGEASDIADKLNRQQFGQSPGGKKI